MQKIKPRYTKDSQGRDIVVLMKSDYTKLIDEMAELREELSDIAEYDKAIAEDDGTRYTMEEVFGEASTS